MTHLSNAASIPHHTNAIGNDTGVEHAGETRLQLDVSIDHAKAIADALDLFTRLSLGQYDELSNRFAFGELPVACGDSNAGRLPTVEECCEYRRLCTELKCLAGHAHGSSFGLGSPAVSKAAHRNYEVMKALKQQLALHRDPAPSFRGVDYDGLTVRYALETAPTCAISPAK